MGNVDWNPANLAKNWMNVCKGFQGLPFISQTLWQIGPMPWLMNLTSSSFDWDNGNWGRFDGFDRSDSTKKPEKEKPAAKTPEERQAEREEKAAKKAEINKLVKNYNDMYSALEEYGKTLTDSTEPTKEVFDETLADLKGKANKNMTKEKIEEKITEIKVMYEKYETKIQETKANKIKSEVTTTNNPQYKDTVGNLKSKIENGSDKTFGILTETSSGTLEWGKIGSGDNKKDIDVMELLSSWYSEYVGKGSHASIIKFIAAKRVDKTGEAKGNYDELSNQLHDKLYAAAENIQEDKLSAESKAAFEKAMEDFEKFDTIDKRFPKDESPVGSNYNQAFENLYIAIRKAEAEIADNKLSKAFEFLGDENPYKNSTALRDAVNADLKKECNEVKAVTAPVAPSVPSGAKEIKSEGVSYHVLEGEGGTTYYKADGTEMTAEEFKNTVGEVTFNTENGAYSIKKGETTYYYKADHTPGVAATFNGEEEKDPDDKTVKHDFTDEEVIAFFNADTRDKGQEHYDAWCAYGRKLADKLIGYTTTDAANKAADIIFNKMNVKNIFTALAGYEDNDAGGDNIIEQLLTENNFSGKYTGADGQEKSANASQCIKQIIDLAVTNLKIQKANNNIDDTAQLDSDIAKLEQYSSSTAILTEDQAEEIDDILHRYSDMVDDKIEYNDDVDDSKIWTS